MAAGETCCLAWVSIICYESRVDVIRNNAPVIFVKQYECVTRCVTSRCTDSARKYNANIVSKSPVIFSNRCRADSTVGFEPLYLWRLIDVVSSCVCV